MKLTERLGKEWVFFDGGMGTILQAHGLKAGELPETWNLSHPDEIIALNRSYFEAGCDVVNTNTFGANALKYPDNLREIVEAAVSHAKTARSLAGREEAFVALDIGPTGKLLQPMGDLPFERAVELFSETIRIGAAAGADLVLIETMSDSYEAKAAVLAAKESCDLPVVVTTIFDEKGKLLTGGTVDSVVAMLEGLRVDALGVNCGLGPVADEADHQAPDRGFLASDCCQSECRSAAQRKRHDGIRYRRRGVCRLSWERSPAWACTRSAAAAARHRRTSVK